MAQTSTHQYPTTHVAYSPYCLPLRNGGRELLASFGRRHIRFWTLQGLEGAASVSGAPPVGPDRLAGGDPRLNVCDATNAKLPLQPRRDILPSLGVGCVEVSQLPCIRPCEAIALC